MFAQVRKVEYDKRKALLEKFSLAGGPQKETLVVTEKLKAQCKEQYDDCVTLWRYQLQANDHSVADENIKIRIVEPKFRLYTKFQEWNKEWLTNGTDPTFLFCEINNENAGKFLNPLNVTLTGPYFYIAVRLLPFHLVDLRYFYFTFFAMQRPQHAIRPRNGRALRMEDC
jgi:hypothetical protein